MQRLALSRARPTTRVPDMKSISLPEGKYDARVAKRQTLSGESGRTCIELTFELTTPPFAGRAVSGRYYNQVMIDRARSLKQNQAVRISVVVRRSQRGRQFPFVKDFRGADQPTVVTYINGVCTDSPAGN